MSDNKYNVQLQLRQNIKKLAKEGKIHIHN